ncbi:MAG: HPr(Ser) kinase/phosphatase [Candidatus Kapabacteria bacterium]|nr:HPr(Ser) kinase/phosphatase [Candidatus Kapabacteria bacterium]
MTSTLDNIVPLKIDKITVDELLVSDLKLIKLTDKVGLDNIITNKNIYRPQLALTGNLGFFNRNSVQVFGNTEIFYLNSLTKKKKIEAFKTLAHYKPPCIVITNGHKLEEELLDIARDEGIAVLATQYDTTKTTFILLEYLDDRFATQAVLHGSFVDVFGVGLLFVGKSGIGKSEIALDLVERGHRLVADDIILLTKKKEKIIMGTGTSVVQHHMEVRGLGFIDIRKMFGIRSVRFQKRLEIIVELVEYKHGEEYERVGLDEHPRKILDVEVSSVTLPIFPGKNITVIAEVIAINYLLRTYDSNPAWELSNRLQQELERKTKDPNMFRDMRYIKDFQGDTE